MLPQDTKQRRQAFLDRSVKAPQASATDYFKPETEKPIAQSDKSFAYAAIEWLIQTDQASVFSSHSSKRRTELMAPFQPLQAFEQPSFKKMIDLVSNGSIALPSPRQTCRYIIKTFKQQMCLLKERLNVSSFILYLYSL